jgi:hypothetical protein
MKILLLGLVSSDRTAKGKLKVPRDVRDTASDNLKGGSTQRIMSTSGVVSSVTPRLSREAPESRPESRLIDEQGSNAFARCLDLTLHWILILTLGSSRIDSNTIYLQEVYSLGGVLGGSSIKANLLDHMAMKIIEVDDMCEGFIEGCTRLFSDHDGMTITTHEALE